MEMIADVCRQRDFLKLLQLADSSLPIGTLAHSFGLESLVEDGVVSVDNLDEFCASLLTEGLLLDAVYCRAAYLSTSMCDLMNLNSRLNALRPSREARQASLSLGKRLLSLISHLENSAALQAAASSGEVLYPVAFGFLCGILRLDHELSILAFLQQNIAAILSAAQRLLPLGQMRSSQFLWRFKPAIEQTARRSCLESIDSVCSFNHLPELASMRHTFLETRLFIS